MPTTTQKRLGNDTRISEYAERSVESTVSPLERFCTQIVHLADRLSVAVAIRLVLDCVLYSIRHCPHHQGQGHRTSDVRYSAEA